MSILVLKLKWPKSITYNKLSRFLALEILEPEEDSELSDPKDSNTEYDVEIQVNAPEREENDDTTDFEKNDQQTVDVEPKREDDFESSKCHLYWWRIIIQRSSI